MVCEKPCTTSAEQTRALFRLARERGRFLMEAEKMLFLPAVQEVQEKGLPAWGSGPHPHGGIPAFLSRRHNGWM